MKVKFNNAATITNDPVSLQDATISVKSILCSIWLLSFLEDAAISDKSIVLKM